MGFPFSLISGSLLNSSMGAQAAIIRSTVATCVWFGFTRLFDIIRETLDTDLDISGHAFILIWSNLFLVEEGKAYTNLETTEVNQRLPNLLKWFAKMLLVAMAALSVLWDIMFFSTMLFYHTWEEKAIAITLAVLNWCLVYCVLYRKFVPWLCPKSDQRQAQG